MKNKKYCQVMVPVLVVSMFLGGCNNSAKEYEKAMEKAKQNVKSEDYVNALENFDSALKYKEGDKEAENLREQVSLLLDAQAAKDGNDYSSQMENLDKIDSIKTDSSVVKDKADEYKSKAEEFTRDEAIEIAETKAGIDKSDKSENHPYVTVAEEPCYDNGKKAYWATYWEYNYDWWIHQGFYVYADETK